jgi:hypothetical protein
MLGLFRLFMCVAVLLSGGLLAIRLLYGVSWRESLEIANCFIEDLLG